MISFDSNPNTGGTVTLNFETAEEARNIANLLYSSEVVEAASSKFNEAAREELADFFKSLASAMYQLTV